MREAAEGCSHWTAPCAPASSSARTRATSPARIASSSAPRPLSAAKRCLRDRCTTLASRPRATSGATTPAVAARNHAACAAGALPSRLNPASAASTAPLSTAGSWSGSPTRTRRASAGTRIDQARHHRQVDHRALVDDQGIERQRVRGVMLRAHAESTLAQQAVQRGRGDRRRERPQRFGEPRRGLAGRRGEPDAERRSKALAPQAHHARDGPGLAGARPAAQHQQAPIERQRQRNALPVQRVVGRLAQQRGDAPRFLGGVAPGRAFAQVQRQLDLVLAVASQVQAPALLQYQRQARVGRADEGRVDGSRAQGRRRGSVGIAARQRIGLVQVQAGVALRHGTQGEAGQGQVRRRRAGPATRQRALQRLRGILGRMGAEQRRQGHGCSVPSSKARSRASTSATGGRSRCTPWAPSRDMPRRNRYSAPPRWRSGS